VGDIEIVYKAKAYPEAAFFLEKKKSMATLTSKLCNEVVGLHCSFLQLTRQSTLYAHFCLHSNCSVSALKLCNLACLPVYDHYCTLTEFLAG